MPRKSAESQQIARLIPLRQPRIRCPDGMPPAVKDRFIAIVSAAPADQFKPSDSPLVTRLAMVRMMLESDETSLPDFLALTKAELAICRALRLCPSARTDSRGAGRKTSGPMGIAEYLDVTGGDDDTQG